MERIGNDIGMERRFPPDFPTFEIGHCLNVKGYATDEDDFYRIVNKTPVHKVVKYDSDWLLAADASRELGDIDDWLQTTEKTQLMCLAIGFRCDRLLDIKISMPASETIFGIKEQPTVWLTPNESPVDQPQVWFWTREQTYIPSFRLENNTEYKPIVFEMEGRGYKYQLMSLESRPKVYHEIVLSHVRGGD